MPTVRASFTGRPGPVVVGRAIVSPSFAFLSVLVVAVF